VRILLVALNARYVHTNLAVRYLRGGFEKKALKGTEVHVREFSINDRLEYIAGEIFEEKPDIIGFSCYIWNMSQMIVLLRNLRLVLPQSFLVAGGPEVSFDPEDLLIRVPQLDGVIIGEGEKVFPDLIENLFRGKFPFQVRNLVWRFRAVSARGNLVMDLIPERFPGKVRKDGTDIIVSNQIESELPDLNDLPNPYSQPENFHGRLVYAETSRGCPFHCEFCISSTIRGIRYLEPEKFRYILRQLLLSGARTVKFVDRTFNVSKDHGFAILNIFREEVLKARKEGILQPEEVPRAHCEIAGEFLNEEWISFLGNFPQGMIQVEIGVQSTYPPALRTVKRPQRFAAWKEQARILQHRFGIPVHLDLIAGLPGEGLREFRNSFNDVIEVQPDNLQLGFLKVLKGSGVREKSSDFGLVYSPDPPYSILRTKELAYSEVLDLKKLEEMLERYYNSGKFHYSMKYVLQSVISPFDFFHSLADFWKEKGWFGLEWNTKALFSNLWEFLTEKDNKAEGIRKYLAGKEKIWKEILRFDYFLLERPGQVPLFLQGNRSGKEWDPVRETIRSHPNWKLVIPDAKELDRRQWSRATAVEYFDINLETGQGAGAWYLFYYGKKGKRYFKAVNIKNIVCNLNQDKLE